MMTRHARRGRPRVLRLQADQGTPELQRKKHAGETLEMLDIMRMHLELPDETLMPAYRFRWLHSIKFGLPYARTTVFDQFASHQGTLLDEAERAECIREYNALCRALSGRGLLQSFMNMVIYDRRPANREALVRDGVKFRESLDFLKKLHSSGRAKRVILINKT